ncbi:MAG: hypothetical protein AAF602_03165, partial [Myxococcota bacterium]
GTAGLVMGTTFVALGSWLHSLVTMLGGREALASLRTISLALAGLCLGGGLVGMLGSAVGLGVLDAGLASPLGLRQAVAGGAVLVTGSALVLSGGLNLAGLALDAVRRRR